MNDNDQPKRLPLFRFVDLQNGRIVRFETPWVAFEVSRGFMLFAATTLPTFVAMLSTYTSHSC